MGEQLRMADLPSIDQRLVQRAHCASRNAYAPYSGFAVGAAVRTRNQNIYVGANLENASYGIGLCAELAAIMAANSAGDFAVEAIAVVGYRFVPPKDASVVVTPCGRCRQMIAEAADVAAVDVRVLSCAGDLSRIEVAPISELLPHAFGPASLGLKNVWLKLRADLQPPVINAELSS